MFNNLFYAVMMSQIYYFLGGGGVGKTYLIKTVSKWIEKILMKAGEANKLKVLLLAFTGVAASLIGKHHLINNMKAFSSNLVLFCFRRNYFSLWHWFYVGSRSLVND